MAPPNPSGLVPTDFRPIVQTDAEKIIAAANAAFTAPADASNQITTNSTVAGGDDIPVLTATITPAKTGSKIRALAVLNGQLLGAGSVGVYLYDFTGSATFGSQGKLTLAGAGDVNMTTIGEVAGATKGVPFPVELHLAPVGANFDLHSSAAYGAQLLLEEVGGT